MAYEISYLDINKLKTWFRSWYGNLSITELAANRELSHKIQEIENLLHELNCGK
jgi:hypothetical protein